MTNINKEIQKELIDINFDLEFDLENPEELNQALDNLTHVSPGLTDIGFSLDLEKLSEILAVSTILSQHDRPCRYAYSFNRASKIRESDNGSSWQKWRVIV